MTNVEKVIKGLEICSEHGSWHGLDCKNNEAYKDCPYHGCKTGCVVTIAKDAITLLKENDKIKEQFIEAFNTIKNAYNEPLNREKILLNYLLRNACCYE